MKLKELIEELDLQVKSGAERIDRDVHGGYVSDMLSDVLKHASEGDVWVTVQIHMNVMAIASLKDVAAVIIANAREPEQDALDKAAEEGIPVLGSAMNSYEIVGRMYQLGLHAQHDDR